VILSSVRVVAFDCDGVLFDSSKANKTYYNDILSHFRMPEMTLEQQKYVHMHTVHESLDYLFGDPEKAHAAEDYRREMKPGRYIRLMMPDPYLDTVMKALRSRYRTAIATNRVDTMDRVLAEHHLDNQFDLIVTAADVERPKPHPDLLLKVLEYFTVKAEEMIYIGDSALDEEAAAKAAVPFIAYGNTFLRAEAHIEHLGQLLPLLQLVC
jgi:phosphoglycolate phosphatase